MPERTPTCFNCGIEGPAADFIMVAPSRRVSQDGRSKYALTGGWLVCRDKRACWARSKAQGRRRMGHAESFQ